VAARFVLTGVGTYVSLQRTLYDGGERVPGAAIGFPEKGLGRVVVTEEQMVPVYVRSAQRAREGLFYVFPSVFGQEPRFQTRTMKFVSTEGLVVCKLVQTNGTH
jgi:hypothetical protein